MKKGKIQLFGSVWITIDRKNFGGSGRIALLAKIAELGSISKVAKSLKMSYKTAWDAVDTMNNLAGEPVVRRLKGGKDGGGTELTTRGKQLVENFKKIEQAHKNFVNYLSDQAKNITKDLLLIKRMSMKTSARNQFLGKVIEIKRGKVNDEIVLEIIGKQKIVAVITQESTNDLALNIGSEVFILIKSSSIILVTDNKDRKFSARNCLSGTVSRIKSGEVNSEVVINLPGGSSVVAIITNESKTSLKLTVNKKVSTIFKASSVILCTPL